MSGPVKSPPRRRSPGWSARRRSSATAAAPPSHVGITVADLDSVTAFFVGLGLEVAGRTFLEGEFIDGGIGQHENTWRMAQVRGPEGIAIS